MYGDWSDIITIYNALLINYYHTRWILSANRKKLVSDLSGPVDCYLISSSDGCLIVLSLPRLIKSSSSHTWFCAGWCNVELKPSVSMLMEQRAWQSPEWWVSTGCHQMLCVVVGEGDGGGCRLGGTRCSTAGRAWCLLCLFGDGWRGFWMSAGGCTAVSGWSVG
jgi:hypothetical protein